MGGTTEALGEGETKQVQGQTKGTGAADIENPPVV